jgi:hypothetical protein
MQRDKQLNKSLKDLMAYVQNKNWIEKFKVK